MQISRKKNDSLTLAQTLETDTLLLKYH